MGSTLATAPGSLPWVGHAVAIVRDRFRFLRSLPDHGDLVWIRIGPWKALVVTTDALSAQVLRDDRTFDKGGPLYDRIRETGGNGLASCPYDDHRRQRRLVQPCFQADRIPGYVPVMRRQAVQMVDSWREGSPVDVLVDMRVMAARTALATMFSGAPTDSVLDTLVKEVDTVLSGIVRRALMPEWLAGFPTPGNRSYRRAQARTRETVAGLVAGYRRQESDRGDLMSALVATRDPENGNKGLCKSELQDQVLTFLVAGTETTASTLSWALHLVAQHPHVDAQLYEEAAKFLGREGDACADPARLVVARNVVLETLRLYPPLPMLTRVTTRETELGGHTVPQGTTVIFSPYTVQHRPGLYADPEAFLPERWADCAPGFRPPRGPFVAFGGGARKCIGDTFALTHATLALSSIAARWRLHALTDRTPKPATSMTMSPSRLRLLPEKRHPLTVPVHGPPAGR
ncbi:cytochrome P450 [Streptomyces sp. NPDC058657]